MNGFVKNKSIMDGARIEGWNTPDLIWEDKQYGHWNKVFIQNFKGLSVIEESKSYDIFLKSNIIILTCIFESIESLTKYDNDWNKNSQWKSQENDFVSLPVMYNATDGSKPIQSFLIPDNLEKLYKE